MLSHINIASACPLLAHNGTVIQTLGGREIAFGFRLLTQIHTMAVSLLAIILYGLAALPSASAVTNTRYCSVLETASSSSECRSLPNNFLQERAASASASATAFASSGSTPDITILQNTFKALADLQNDYFKQAKNNWPDSIDWTGAVVQTIVSGTMSTLTQSLDAAVPGQDWKQKENLLSFLHEQIVSYYFGQQADRILTEVCAINLPCWDVKVADMCLTGVRRCALGRPRLDRGHQVPSSPRRLALPRRGLQRQVYPGGHSSSC